MLANSIEYLGTKKETQEESVEQPKLEEDPFATFGNAVEIQDYILE